MDSTIDEQWIQIRDIYSEGAEKLLGVLKREHKDWISAETHRAVGERKKIKVKIGKW